MVKVLKFGGSSVADAEAMQRVTGHILRALAKGDKIIVVVSALAKVTNQLTALAWHARERKEINHEMLQDIEQRHQTLVQQLFNGKNIFLERIETWLSGLFGELQHELSALIDVNNTCDANREGPFAEAMAQILAHGELASSTILHLLLLAKGIRNLWMDARELIITDNHWLQAKPDFSVTKERVLCMLQVQLDQYDLIIVPGFMGGTAGGRTTLLGREGSDYSAAILAEALSADELQIWSDVNGVMEVDPRYVEKAAILPYLSYGQAGELATWGGKILYPSTVEPAKRSNVPIGIFNSFATGDSVIDAGTCIGSEENRRLWAIGGLARPLVIRWQGESNDIRSFIVQLSAYNLELRGLFPLTSGFLIILQDHHRPSGGDSLDYAWLAQYPNVEFSVDWDLVAVISADLVAAEQDLTTIDRAWLLPATGLAHSRVALVPQGRLNCILLNLYNRRHTC